MEDLAPQTAAQQAESLARAEEVLGEPLNDPRCDDGAGNHAPETMAELVDGAKRALIRRMASMADSDITGIENVAEAYRALEYA